MLVTSKVFAQDSKDPIELQLNQDLTGLTVSIRTRMLATGTEVAGNATIPDPPTDMRCLREWATNEKPIGGSLCVIEAVVTWPDGKTRTFPSANEPPIIVEIEPRRSQVGA